MNLSKHLRKTADDIAKLSLGGDQKALLSLTGKIRNCNEMEVGTTGYYIKMTTLPSLETAILAGQK